MTPPEARRGAPVASPTPAPSPAPVSARATVLLRRATPMDVDAIAAIERASFSDPWTRDAFAQLAERAARHEVSFRVAEIDGAVAGYLVGWFAADEGELANVAVAAAWQGRGVASALLDELLAAAAARAVTAVYLEVRESNARAQALYATRGFEAVGRRRGYYRRPVEDALVLRRQLVQRGST
jgi:ribosomal-protein-alanine N-acetyltransferase